MKKHQIPKKSVSLMALPFNKRRQKSEIDLKKLLGRKRVGTSASETGIASRKGNGLIQKDMWLVGPCTRSIKQKLITILSSDNRIRKGRTTSKRAHDVTTKAGKLTSAKQQDATQSSAGTRADVEEKEKRVGAEKTEGRKGVAVSSSSASLGSGKAETAITTAHLCQPHVKQLHTCTTNTDTKIGRAHV